MAVMKNSSGEGDFSIIDDTITEAVPKLEKEIAQLKDRMSNVDRFIALAKRHIHITELTPEILNTFIDRIVIGERENPHSRNAPRQSIKIFYKGFGEYDSEYYDQGC